jgi:hypothetical protein
MTKTDPICAETEESTPNSHTSVTMATLAALITAAIIKVAETNPALDREGGPSADEARIAFTEALLIELGLAPTPVAAHAPVSEPTATPTKAKKEKAPAAPKKAKKAAAAVDPDVEALTAAVAELTITPAAEAPKAAKKEAEVKPEVKPGSNAGAGAEPEPKKKPGPKPKAVKAEGPVNLDKLNPTQKKHLKKIAEELKVDPREKEFLTYANGMAAEEWSAKPLDDHIRAFLMPEPLPLTAAPTEFYRVEFKGVDYLVDPTSKFVYEDVPEDAPVRKRIGVVGQMAFEKMVLPEDA